MASPTVTQQNTDKLKTQEAARVWALSEATWLGHLGHSVHPPPLGARESDVQGSKGLHQGDLCVRICFAPAGVPVAVPALQGFVTVPLLLPSLLLQPLLLPPLLVCHLEEPVAAGVTRADSTRPRMLSARTEKTSPGD